ncbi:flavin reductase family protein [Shouchella lonarensis]|uniref:NADH-FMN oxidoreductase RutF, flavin reductase (DIM6/NTAB) family n=1 Tax=Shouchella lonarensis TaxID=1464122 RepID=A0A1G6HK05_9BACI|nr:flavin reductase family protein [Shouchella lonarensis]SDB94534.1 NADH-FMN oxidoreductase RutF, flavin reductase (DIM6/NTAB) family [Shouchella lonarensis]
MDEQRFRTAMSRFPTGVTVITTNIDGITHGMTANAFMSVSLNPMLIAVSVANKAAMHAYLAQSGRFAVNLLTKQQADISTHFAGGPQVDNISFETFDQLPILRDALAYITCDVHNAHQEGDHTIYIGAVRDLVVNDEQPLAYFSGKYCGVM